MKVIEHTQDSLILRSSTSLWVLLLIGFFAELVSFFFLIGLLLQQTDYPGIIWIGMGSATIVGIPLFIIKFSKVDIFTFEKSKNCILWEQRSLSAIKSVRFPAHLIVGVEITDSSTDAGPSYYPRLLLSSVYWRIPLEGNTHYENAVTLAKTISQFLNIDYYLDDSKAPIPTWRQQTSKCAEPWQPHWKYLENEVDRLRYHVLQHPEDAEAHQDLGISLYYSNRLNQKDSIVHLQRAEKLFELQQDEDSAAIARVIQALISCGY